MFLIFPKQVCYSELRIVPVRSLTALLGLCLWLWLWLCLMFGLELTLSRSHAQSTETIESEPVVSFQGLISPQLSTRPSEFLIENWGVRNGLPRSGVTAIAQTPDGFLWLGLEKGLARFDGSQFKRYLPTAYPGLVKRPVTTLFVDQAGRLWIGSKGDGVSVLESGQFRKMDRSNPIFGDEIYQFAQDTDGVIWRASLNGLHFYHNDEAHPYPQEETALAGAISYKVSLDSISGRIYGCYWETAGTWKGEEFEAVMEAQSGKPVPSNNFFSRKDGGIWFLSSDVSNYGALHRMLPDGKLTPPQSWPFEVPQYHISAFLEDSGGGLWISVTEDAVYRVGLDGVYERFGMGTGVITTLFEDRDGSIWAGSPVAGLFRIKRRLFRAYPEAGSNSAHMIFSDHHGGVIFTQGDEVFQINQEGHLSSLGVKSHYGALLDHQDNIWSGIQGGLAQWMNKGSGFEAIDLDRRTVFYGCQSLFLSESRALWFAGNSGGIARRVAGETSIIDTETGTVTAFADAGRGDVWLGYNTGMILKSDDISLVSIPGLTHRIQDTISSLLVENDQSLWIATLGGGLYHWSHEGLMQFTSRFGLPSDEIGGIVIYNDAIWLATTNGVASILLTELEAVEKGLANTVNCLIYGVEDGLPNLECSTEYFPAIHLSEQGTLWIATSEGIASVNANEIPDKFSDPPVYIEQVLIDDKASEPGSDPVVIPAGSARLSFHYTGVTLNTSQRARFQYRLVGQDQDWVDAWGSREAHYTKLPPGDYSFMARASDHQGVWSRSPAKVHLRMLPFIWQTTEFKIGVAAGSAILIALTAWLITRGAYLGYIKKLVQERAIEQERARIAQDLHDRLGSQSTQIIFLTKALNEYVSRQDWQEMKMFSDRIRSTAKDMTISLDEIIWTTDPSKDNVESSMAFFIAYAESYFKDTSTRLRVDIPMSIESREFSMEARHEVFLAIREALANVLKHAKASEVWLSIKLKENRLRIQVDDDGVGIQSQVEDKGRSGLRNIQRRMESIGGTVDYKSSAVGGFSVQIEIPFSKSETSMSHQYATGNSEK
jgi:signal transduction histidine kinase/ligand-binding sensor domain-containing protein